MMKVWQAMRTWRKVALKNSAKLPLASFLIRSLRERGVGAENMCLITVARFRPAIERLKIQRFRDYPRYNM